MYSVNLNQFAVVLVVIGGKYWLDVPLPTSVGRTIPTTRTKLCGIVVVYATNHYWPYKATYLSVWGLS